MDRVSIEEMAWDEVEAAFASGRPVIIPIGAFAKEHGLHLPMNTDAIVAGALGEAVARRIDGLVAPVVGFGHYPAFVRYAGSQTLSSGIFVGLLVELMQGFVAQGVRRLILLNTGVSTEDAVVQAATDIRTRFAVAAVDIHLRHLGAGAGIDWEQTGGGHADARETSLMLALAPAKVRLERARNEERPNGSVGHAVLSPTPDADADHSPSGATGNPMAASQAKGRRLLETILDEMVALAKQTQPG